MTTDFQSSGEKRTKPCRDCGYPLEPGLRGCPQCALNIEAENMIDRFVRRGFLVALLVVAVGIGLGYYFLS